MPRLDIYHDTVRRALERDGWTITDDPLILQVGLKRLYVDLGASNLIAANKDEKHIAVEIKTFQGKSDVQDLELALGQYNLYQYVMDSQDSDRTLYLAVSDETYQTVFTSDLGQIVVAQAKLNLLIFDVQKEVIQEWIKQS